MSALVAVDLVLSNLSPHSTPARRSLPAVVLGDEGMLVAQDRGNRDGDPGAAWDCVGVEVEEESRARRPQHSSHNKRGIKSTGSKSNSNSNNSS